MKQVNLEMSPIDLDLSVDQNVQKIIIELAQQGFTVGASDLDLMKQAIADAMDGDDSDFARGNA